MSDVMQTPTSGVDQGGESGPPAARPVSGGRQQPGELVPDAALTEKGGAGHTAARPASPLAAALAALQAELPTIAKDQTAKVTGETKAGKPVSYTYTYADLSEISAVVMRLLGKHGLSFTARPTLSGGAFVLAYKLLHVSGENDPGEYPLPDPLRSTPQAIGSAITYARRYCLCAVTGVAPGGDDDDARAAAADAARHAESQTQLAADVAEGRDKVRSAWAVSFGTEASECAAFYGRWPDAKAGNLWDADGAELRRFAGYLSNLPPAVAGSDPATVDQPQGAELVEGGGGPRLNPKQRAEIFARFKECNLRSKREQLDFIGGVIGKPVESRGDLSPLEADDVIAALKAYKPPAGAQAPVSGRVEPTASEKPAATEHPAAGPDAPAGPNT